MASYVVHSTLRPIGSQVLNRAGVHSYIVDEPVVAKGTDAGPNPVQYFLGSIGSCMGATAKDIQNHRPDLEIKQFNVDVYGETEHHEDGTSKVINIKIKIKAKTNLDEEKHQEFLADVIRMCTVHATIEGSVPMHIEIE